MYPASFSKDELQAMEAAERFKAKDMGASGFQCDESAAERLKSASRGRFNSYAPAKPFIPGCPYKKVDIIA